MDERRIQGTVVAVLGVLAVILAAAAAAPLFSEEPGGGGSPSMQTPTGNESSTNPPTGLPDVLEPLIAALLVFGAIFVAIQFVSDPVETLKEIGGAILGGAAFLGLIGLLYLLSQSGGTDGQPQGPPPTGTPSPTGQGGFGEGTSDPLALPFEDIAILVLVAGVLGALTLLAWRSETVQSALGLDSETPALDDDLETVGRIAGDTADRVEAARTPTAADNAIYRAWSDMVALLDDADPTAATPRKFESAAVEAGMDPDDVAIVTRTFEEVRYGEEPLTEERRTRAVAAFRRIESAVSSSSAEVDSAAGRRPERGDSGSPGGQ